MFVLRLFIYFLIYLINLIIYIFSKILLQLVCFTLTITFTSLIHHQNRFWELPYPYIHHVPSFIFTNYINFAHIGFINFSLLKHAIINNFHNSGQNFKSNYKKQNHNLEKLSWKIARRAFIMKWEKIYHRSEDQNANKTIWHCYGETIPSQHIIFLKATNHTWKLRNPIAYRIYSSKTGRKKYIYTDANHWIQKK